MHQCNIEQCIFLLDALVFFHPAIHIKFQYNAFTHVSIECINYKVYSMCVINACIFTHTFFLSLTFRTLIMHGFFFLSLSFDTLIPSFTNYRTHLHHTTSTLHPTIFFFLWISGFGFVLIMLLLLYIKHYVLVWTE